MCFVVFKSKLIYFIISYTIYSELIHKGFSQNNVVSGFQTYPSLYRATLKFCSIFLWSFWGFTFKTLIFISLLPWRKPMSSLGNNKSVLNFMFMELSKDHTCLITANKYFRNEYIFSNLPVYWPYFFMVVMWNTTMSMSWRGMQFGPPENVLAPSPGRQAMLIILNIFFYMHAFFTEMVYVYNYVLHM